MDREFNGTKIIQRADGYLDATAMCKATGKLFGNYKQLNSTQQFLIALSTDIGYPISEIIQVVKGGAPGHQGTWVHPQVAINLAQWRSIIVLVEYANGVIITSKIRIFK